MNQNVDKAITMTVLGAGSYGTSLAISLARNGANVILWGHEPEHMHSSKSIGRMRHFCRVFRFLTR